jgi:DNA-binding beta-propeller fold protein YncE
MKLANVGRFGTILLFAVVAACFLVSASAQSKPGASGYHLLKTISLPAAPGGDEYFDYISLDADARRVYVSHGTEVVILNADDYSVAGKIGGLSRCHGIAIAKDLGKGFISDGDGRPGATVQQVVIFDLKTLKVTGKVSTAQPDTDAIIYEPVTKHVYTFNGDSHNSTVIDPEKQAVIATIELVGKVEYPAVDGKGMIYDNNPKRTTSLPLRLVRIRSKRAGPQLQKDSRPL